MKSFALSIFITVCCVACGTSSDTEEPAATSTTVAATTTIASATTTTKAQTTTTNVADTFIPPYDEIARRAQRCADRDRNCYSNVFAEYWDAAHPDHGRCVSEGVPQVLTDDELRSYVIGIIADDQQVSDGLQDAVTAAVYRASVQCEADGQ